MLLHLLAALWLMRWLILAGFVGLGVLFLIDVSGGSRDCWQVEEFDPNENVTYVNFRDPR